jgi:H+/Cl- antiporter ClcA
MYLCPLRPFHITWPNCEHAAARRVVVVTASALVAHTAWHWLVDRADKLRYVGWPEWTAETITTAAGVALLLGLMAWAAWRWIRQAERRRPDTPSGSAE